MITIEHLEHELAVLRLSGTPWDTLDPSTRIDLVKNWGWVVSTEDYMKFYCWSISHNPPGYVGLNLAHVTERLIREYVRTRNT